MAEKNEFQEMWKQNFASKDFKKNIEKSINAPVGEQILDNTTTRTEEVSKPYSQLKDLPEAVQKLPKHAQEIFRAAFNNAYKNPPAGRDAEEYAFAVAWSAVKKAGYKKSILIEYAKKIADILEQGQQIFKSTERITERETPFHFFIEKAHIVDKDGVRVEIQYPSFKKGAEVGELDLENMYIEGIATTTNVDHDMERMSEDAVDAMLKAINEKGVPLKSEHQKTWDATLGEVFKAWKDERNQLHVKAKLDKDSSRAVDLYKALKRGLQVGLSVAGQVKRSAHEFVESLGKRIKTFYDVVLKEISVTNRPSNFDTWIIAKGQTGSLEGHLFGKPHPFFEEYLQNYPSLNWQCEIAKSVAEVSKEAMADEINAEVKKEEIPASEEVKAPENVESPEVEKSLKASFDKMGESFQSLATEIRNLLKQVGEPKTDEETSVDDKETTTEGGKKCVEAKAQETTTDPDKKETETVVKPEAKKEIPVKESDSSTTETTEEKPKEEETTKSTDDEVLSKRAASKIIAEEIEKRLAAEGKRLMGPLQETIEKLMNLPLKRKGVASEHAYVIEKNFSGNPDRKIKGEEEEEEGLKKDLKDPNLTFGDVFKKNFSSFRK